MAFLQSLLDRFHASSRGPRSSAPSGVLLVSSGGLGDTILLSHVIERFYRLALPGEAITVLLRKDGAKTAFMFPKGTETIAVDFGRLRKDRSYRKRIGDELYQANVRLAVSLDYLRHPDLDEYLIFAAAASETTAMVAKPWQKYDAQLNRNRARYDRLYDSGGVLVDKIVRWTAFANWLNGTDDKPPVATRDPQSLPAPVETDKPFVMVQAFSAVKGKQCSPALFERALAQIPDDWDVVFTGAPGEDKANPEFADLLARPGVTYDDSTFEQLVPKLRAARMAISVDTAFMHLAIAVGTPTLGLASAAYVDEIVPYATETTPGNAHFVYHDMPCRSCLGDCRLPPEDGRFPCIARLEPQKVEDAVRGILGAV